MGVTIQKSISELAKKLDERKMASVMRKISKYLVSSAVGKINKGISPENAPLTQSIKQGSKTLRDNGNLMSSIAPQNGNTWAAANTKLKYARLMQYGGVITGKSKDLWIPANDKTRKLMRQYNAHSAGELIPAMMSSGWSCWRQGKVMMAKQKQQTPFVLFIIKKSVTIPARPFLYINQNDESYINKEIEMAVRNMLGGNK